jgi:L-ascorbate metabolism protein UlaG (beta-lactamase superfamily)
MTGLRHLNARAAYDGGFVADSVVGPVPKPVASDGLETDGDAIARREEWNLEGRGLWGKIIRPFRMLWIFWKFMRQKRPTTRPQGEIPIVPMTRAALETAPDRTLWRLGHSTVLVKLEGAFFLTDPVFAERASPVWFAGPKRFHPAPISIKELPPIKAVVLSHDHYDHLDKRAIQKLRKKTELFLTQRGVGGHLRRWGVDAKKIRELDWWEQIEVATAKSPVKLVATPTQHFSGRTLWDRNRTAWGSWVIIDGDLRVFYGGDSGYFDGFREIGAKYGPFDVTLIENGAYNVQWPVVHMQPEETVAAHRDLRGKWLLPIHNGTFDLAFHPWTEPMERVQGLAAREGIQVCTPRFGEPVRLDAMEKGERWWRAVEDGELAAATVRERDARSEKRKASTA